MVSERQKEKAYQAIMFFCDHTSICYKKKLYKLLYILDFEHFEQTGRSVTGYDYFAWKMGPVPTELHEAIENEDAELLKHFDIIRESIGEFEGLKLERKDVFDERYFSDRELELMKNISDRFYQATGNEMEAYTHREGTPWHTVWEKEGRKQKEIPYSYQLAHLSDIERDVILDIVEERKAVLENYT